MAGQYTLQDLGLDNHMQRSFSIVPLSIGGITEDVGAATFTVPNIIRPEILSSGELANITFVGKNSFSDTTTGMRAGIDLDGQYRWIIGDGSNSVDWNVTTANTLTIKGAVSASTIDIGGSDSTSFHVDIDGNMWLGAATYASSIARISKSGEILMASGTIGGWNLSTTVLRSGATDAASNVLIDSANSLLRLGPTSGEYITVDGANQRIRSSNYVSGASGAGFSLEPDLLEVGNIAARGILRSAVFQKGVISAVGGSIQIRPADTLDTDMTALDSSTLTVKGTETFAVNDILRIKDGTNDEWFLVTDITSAPTYTVTRDRASVYAADSNPAWTKGATVLNYGQTGAGGVYITSTDTNAPFIDIFTHTGSPWMDTTTNTRIGNLAGLLDPTSSAALSGFGIWTDNGYFSGKVAASMIVGSAMYTALSGRRVVINQDGIGIHDGSASTKYSEFKYAAKKYGSGFYAHVGSPNKVVPFYISQANAARADLHLIDRADLPTGPNEVGDIAMVDTQVSVCVVAGSPGTWHSLHRARYGTVVKT